MQRSIARSKLNLLLAVLGAILLASSLCGCSPKIRYVPVENQTVLTDTLRLTTLKTDSVYIHDSISLVQRGDTVYLSKYLYRYRDRAVHDTVYSASHDTIHDTKIVEVEKELTRWQKFKQDAGGLAIGGFSVLLIIGVVILLKRLRGN